MHLHRSALISGTPIICEHPRTLDSRLTETDQRHLFFLFSLDLIDEQFKGTRYHSFPDIEHHKILLVIDTNEDADAFVKSPTKSNPALTRWVLFLDGDGILRASITFSAHFFQRSSIQTYADVFKRVIEACALSPLEKLSTMPICTSADVSRIRGWNNTQKAPLDVSSVNNLFRHIANKFPTHIAVTNGRGGLALTYEELDRSSDALALWLIDHGFGGIKETVIGVWQTRGVMLVVSFLACLKAGCVYMVRFSSHLVLFDY